MARNVVAEHPSRGPVGSCYQTHDQQVYVRTPWGSRKVDNAVGPALMMAQYHHTILHQLRRRLMLTTGLVAFIAGAVAGALIF